MTRNNLCIILIALVGIIVEIGLTDLPKIGGAWPPLHIVKTINDVTEVPRHFLYSYRNSKKALGSPPLITIVPKEASFCNIIDSPQFTNLGNR